MGKGLIIGCERNLVAIQWFYIIGAKVEDVREGTLMTQRCGANPLIKYNCPLGLNCFLLLSCPGSLTQLEILIKGRFSPGAPLKLGHCILLKGALRQGCARMRSSRVVRACGRQSRSRNSPGFDPSILRHSGISGAADEAMLNKKNWKADLPLSTVNKFRLNSKRLKSVHHWVRIFVCRFKENFD